MGGYNTDGDEQPDMSTIITKLDSLSDTVDKLDATIRGNGKMGLITQVALLQQIVTEIEKKANSGGKQFITWAWLVEKVFMPVSLTLITAVIMAKLLGS